MVVAAVLGLALALPTGALFGVGYGTGVRIGYEQVYPLLFPVGKKGDSTLTNTNIKHINQIYDAIGGKEASQMGIANGILSHAAGELKTNPDFQVLGELESNASGVTSLNLTLKKILEIQTLSLQESVNYRNSRGSFSQRDDNAEDRPASVLDIPIIIDPSITEEFGPENITDKFGYATMTRTELLNNQPSQMSPKPSNIQERTVSWNHYYQIKLKETTKETTTTTSPPTSDHTAQLAYVTGRNKLFTTALISARASGILSTNQTTRTSAKNKNISNVKALLSYISTQRNNSNHKASLLAKADYNNQFWKKAYYSTHASYRK